MDKQLMLVELRQNCQQKMTTLLTLFKLYDLSVLANDIQEQRIEEINNRILAENEFFAARDYRRDIQIGDRITDAKDNLMMSNEDYNRLNVLMIAALAKAGIVDERGLYIVDTFSQMCNIKREVANFIVDEILPTGMKKQFSAVRTSVACQDKLINIIREQVLDK